MGVEIRGKFFTCLFFILHCFQSLFHLEQLQLQTCGVSGCSLSGHVAIKRLKHTLSLADFPVPQSLFHNVVSFSVSVLQNVYAILLRVHSVVLESGAPLM